MLSLCAKGNGDGRAEQILRVKEVPSYEELDSEVLKAYRKHLTDSVPEWASSEESLLVYRESVLEWHKSMIGMGFHTSIQAVMLLRGLSAHQDKLQLLREAGFHR